MLRSAQMADHRHGMTQRRSLDFLAADRLQGQIETFLELHIHDGSEDKLPRHWIAAVPFHPGQGDFLKGRRILVAHLCPYVGVTPQIVKQVVVLQGDAYVRISTDKQYSSDLCQEIRILLLVHHVLALPTATLT